MIYTFFIYLSSLKKPVQFLTLAWVTVLDWGIAWMQEFVGMQARKRHFRLVEN
jgi:hypothetical protein